MGVIGMGSNYGESFKESMAKKMTGPGAKSATALAEEVDVPQSTLSRWLRDCGRFGSTGDEMSTKKRPQNWTAEEKMEAVIAYNGMNEQEQGLYLRSRGLYSVDIERWGEEMLQALGKKPKKGDPKDRRIRELEGDLRRKEKALAETAALLVLKKKAQAIWGDGEDEK
jgi:transposase-like protein